MNFFIRSTKQAKSTLYFRVVKRNPSINIKISTGIQVDVKAWEKAHRSANTWDKYIHTEDGRVIKDKLDRITESVNHALKDNQITCNANRDIIEKIVDNIVNHNAIKLEEERERLKQQEKDELKKRIIPFYDDFIDGIESGVIKHGKGKTYRKGSIVNWRSFGKHLKGFCTPYNTFDDIDKMFADRFTAYLEQQELMQSSINKSIVNFRKLCNLAADLGINRNATSLRVWKEREVAIDEKRSEIYLSEEEIDAIYNYPLAGIEDNVRDVFLLGCISCQRYSDYGSLSRKNFGTTISGTPIIKIKQTKTGTYVEIPITDNRVWEICDKYDYNFPHINARRINDILQSIIKKVSTVCPSLKEMYTTVLTQQEKNKERHYTELCNKVANSLPMTKEDRRTYRNYKSYADEHNGEPLFARNEKDEVIKFKYELVSTHTARRSGVTNLYKTGLLDTRELMKISGHQTERIFEQYIKMQQSEYADRIAEKLGSLNTNLKIVKKA